jgi:hypothetical protein
LPEPVLPDTTGKDRSASQWDFWRITKLLFKTAIALLIVAVVVVATTQGYDFLKSNDSSKAAAYPEMETKNPATVQEWQLANADHEIIAAAVAACSKIFDLDQPDFVRAELRLDTLPDGRRYVHYFDSKKQVTTELKLTNYQRAAIYLSDSIVRGRIEAATNANVNYSSMFWFQLAIVGIGAITTILISIKSIAPAGNSTATTNLSLWVGILAIIFSSVGTATSALNSFYGPRESYFKSERSLAALRQLHSDIAAKVTSLTDPENCPKMNPTNKDDPYGKQVQDWATKLGAILNSTDSGSSSSQNTGGGSTPPTQPSRGAPAAGG